MFIKLFPLLIAIILIFPKDTYAYLDPGNGSYLIQLILGFLFGGIVSTKLFWKKLKNHLSKKKTNADKNS